MTGFGMSNMDYTPVKFMTKCFEANYPESLGSIIVYKAPWVFQGVWKVIKGWLDPVVAAKVNFADNEKELAQFVPENRIIKELGGSEDWEYKYIEPVAGENDRMNDTQTRDRIQAERQELIDRYQKETTAWATGEGGNAAERKRLVEAMRDNYWKLDPYIRARSVYDRAGIIGEGGRVNFYPNTEAPSAPQASNHSDVD